MASHLWLADSTKGLFSPNKGLEAIASTPVEVAHTEDRYRYRNLGGFPNAKAAHTDGEHYSQFQCAYCKALFWVFPNNKVWRKFWPFTLLTTNKIAALNFDWSAGFTASEGTLMSWKPKTLKKLKKMRTSRLPTKSTALSWKASVTKILMNVRFCTI